MLPPSWREMIASITGNTIFGDAGVRDPENVCTAFEPVEHPDWLGCECRAPGGGDCDGDGHYLCGSCEKLSDRSIAEWGELQ